MSEAFEKAGKAEIFTETLKGDKYEPCIFSRHHVLLSKLSPQDTDSPLDRADLFSSMPNEIDSSYFEDTTLNNISKSVGVTCQETRNIELNT